MQRPVSSTTLIFAMLLLGSFNSIAEASRLTLVPEPYSEKAVTAIYDPATGNLSVKSDHNVTSLEMVSANSLFIPEQINPDVMQSSFDLITRSKWFVLNLDGFTDLNIGPIYPPGIETEAILNDLTVDGSFDGGGALNRDLTTSPHLFIVPEPSSLLMSVLAAAAMLGLLRRKR